MEAEASGVVHSEAEASERVVVVMRGSRRG